MKSRLEAYLIINRRFFCPRVLKSPCGTARYKHRSRPYVVTNYATHLLSAPPRVPWVQVGSDYVLIAIATGLIANIILNN